MFIVCLVCAEVSALGCLYVLIVLFVGVSCRLYLFYLIVVVCCFVDLSVLLLVLLRCYLCLL